MDCERFLHLLDFYPKTAKALQEYAIEQVQHLSEVRKLQEHLHPGNFVEKKERNKIQLYFE